MFVPNSPEDHQALRSAPPARDAVRFGVVSPNHSDGPVLSMSSLPGLRSCLGQPPHNRRSGLSVGVLSRDTYKFEKATEGGFHAGQVTNQTVSLGKFKGRLKLMEKQRGLNVVGIVTENGGCLTVLRIPSASLGPVLDYSLCQMNDGAINVYDGLDLEVGSIVPWSTELNICLGAIKTSFVSVLHFNYRLIVGHFCPCFENR